MKRVLRSAASVSDAKNGLQEQSPKQTLANARPLRRIRDATRKENKENVSTRKKNVRKNVAQPLQEKNSVALQPKNDKTTTSSSSVQTSKPEKPSSSVETVPTNAVSKPRNRRQLVDDKKRTGEEIVTEPNAKIIMDQPPVTSAPDKSIESVTVRKVKQSKTVQQLHSSEKDADRQGNREKTPAQDTLAVDNPTKKTRKNTGEQKVVEKDTTIKPAVPFTTKTRSATKHSGESNASSLRGTRSRKPTTTETPTKKPIVATRSDEKKNKAKTPHASNVKVGHNQKKKSAKPVVPKPKTNAESTSQPKVDSTQFVTIRRNRKEAAKPAKANDDKPQSKVTVISNVTTRRRRSNSQTVTKDNVKDATVSKRKRSQSVYESVPNDKKKMEPKSNIDAIVSPPKKRRITTKVDPKTVDTVTKQQQPELLVNRSSASDSSDQSNASAMPIYKRINSTNNNTVNSGFDFESNSQENTLNGDEETQQLLAQMVRENRASIAKRKGNRKNGGVTKAKGNTTRSKKIEKMRSVLMNGLKELKTRTTNEPASNVTKRRVIPEPPMKSSRKDKSYTNPVIVVDLGDEGNVSAEDSSSYCQKNDKVLPNEQQSTPVDDMDDMVDDLVDDVQFDVEDNASIHKPSSLIKSNTTSTETPPKRVAATYTGPGKESTLHQSTPVQIVNAGNASPWRLNSDGVKYPSNVFSRYSECEKSPIKSGDVTKVAAAVRSPAKKPRPPLTKKPLAHKLPETEKPKTLESDIRNAFGFASDDDADDECYPHRPSLPALNISAIAPHVNASRKKPAPLASSSMKSTKDSTETTTTSSNLFKMPLKVFGHIRAAVQLLKDTQTSVPKPKTQSKISNHFGDASKASSSRGTKMNANTVTTNKYEATRLKESSEPEETTSYTDRDAPSLFETTWLTADEQKPHRSYSRVTKREPKRQKEYKSILADDESDCGDSVVQKRTKRTKPKDDKYQEELRQFEENMNSDFMDIDRFEMIMEKSVSSSNI